MRQLSRETIFPTFKSISILAIFCVSMMIAVNAGAWQGPQGSPPTPNVLPPLNEGTPFGGNGSPTGLANSNIIGKYNNLKISINPCADGQILMWSTAVLATGQVVCGEPALSAGLLEVLNKNANAGGYWGGVVIGSTTATWLNLGGALTASWIHATSSGNNSIMGKLGIGTTTPNKQLHVYNVNPSVNAEIDIQSRLGAGNHWGIYHDATTNELRFWQGDDRVKFSSGGTVTATDFCTLSGKCLGGSTASGYVGATIIAYKGDLNGASPNGYKIANGACSSVGGALSGSHVCTVEEILYSINSNTVPALPASGQYWVSNGAPNAGTNGDCAGWTTTGGFAMVWVFGTAQGRSTQTSCGTPFKFLCCK